MSNNQIDVLFVCTHNAGRSVIAKTLFNDRSSKLGLDMRAESAGTVPVDRINQNVQRVLESFMIDASQETPKLLTDDLLASNPRIVTMGCEVDAASCPAVSFADVEDWGLPDPSQRSDDAEIVPLVHEIARRVNTMIQHMTSAGLPSIVNRT